MPGAPKGPRAELLPGFLRHFLVSRQKQGSLEASAGVTGSTTLAGRSLLPTDQTGSPFSWI